MSQLHFTSDCHFGHKNIIKFCNRPFVDVAEMDEALIYNWNQVVKPNDIVWQLGDFTFYRDYNKLKSILVRLNGHKKAVLGNHCELIIAKKHDLLADGLFEEIVERKVLSVNKQKIILDHYPGRSWNYSSHGGWQLFGHVHGTMSPHGKSVDVGVDATWVTGTAPYRPLSFDEIKSFMDTQEIYKEFDKE